MANKYFNWPGSLRRFVRFDAARSEDVNDALDEVSTAMDGVETDTKRSIKLPASGTDQLLDMAPEQRANLVIGFDPSGALAALPGGGRFAGDWAAGTAYLVSETFRDPVTKNIYSTAIAHTSATIAGDLAAGRIRLAVNVADVEAAKAAAIASAGVSATKADLAVEQAGIATEQAQLATNNGAAQVTLATAQADAAMGYRNTANAAANTATTQASNASASASSANGSAIAASAQADIAATKAAEAAASAASISSGPVTSVNSKTGVVELSATDIAPAATTAEMQAGSQAGYRSMSPALVAQAIASLATLKIVRSERTANTALSFADNGKWIDITSGTFTQTFLAPAALGAGWWCYLRNSGTGDITIPASDGRTNWIMYPGEMRLLQCDGAALWSIVLNAFYKVFTASGNFIKPPGYVVFEGLMWGGGGSGSRNYTSSTNASAGGGGGACTPIAISSGNLLASESVVIGAGGAGQPTNNQPGFAGGTSTFKNITAFGGGGGAKSVANGAAVGGGGGGSLSVGSTDGQASPNYGQPTGAVAFYGGAHGGSITGAGSKAVFGGGGGGGTDNTVGTPGGDSIYGGGGGAGNINSPSNGVAPGGGGGGAINSTSGAGARGELRIWGVI